MNRDKRVIFILETLDRIEDMYRGHKFEAFMISLTGKLRNYTYSLESKLEESVNKSNR